MNVWPDITLQRLSSFLLLQRPKGEIEGRGASVTLWFTPRKDIYWNGFHGNQTDPEKQWAAVTTQRGDTSVPPHVCWPPCCRLTCQGQCSIEASVPPTIRPSETTEPQSDKEEHLVKITTVVHLKPTFCPDPFIITAVKKTCFLVTNERNVCLDMYGLVSVKHFPPMSPSPPC